MPWQLTQWQRGTVSPVITRFKGIDCFSTYVNSSPDRARDLMNVVCNVSGGLEKLRIPAIMSTAAVAGDCYGVFDFEQGSGTHQIIGVFGTKVFKYEFQEDGRLVGTVIDDNGLNAYLWSMETSNNILFMANGKRMMKWTGEDLWKWGISKAPTPPALTNSTVTPDPCQFSAYNIQQYDGKLWLAIDHAAYDVLNVGDMVTNNGQKTYWGGDPQAYIQNLAGSITDKVSPAWPDGSTGTGSSTYIVAVDIPPNTVFASNGTAYDMGNHDRHPVRSGGAGWGGNPKFTTDSVDGRSYRVCLANSVTGHMGTASEPSLNTGPMNNGTVALDLTDDGTNAAIDDDPQIDSVVIFATGDGGSIWYYHSAVMLDEDRRVPNILDGLSDLALDKTRSAPYYNGVPPIGKYLAKWQDRIFIGNLVGAPQDIVYTGYEAITSGRPEESVPGNNRLRLTLGSNDIRAIGTIQSGIVALSRSNKMYMFRGTVEDITVDTLVSFSEILEELPWQIGGASHYSAKSTPYGLVWFGSDHLIDLYNGAGEPTSFAINISPLLAKVSKANEQSAIGCYFKYLEKDLYILAVPTGQHNDQGKPDQIFLLDLCPDAERNVGIYKFDIGTFDYLTVVQAADGMAMVLVAQGGELRQLNVVSNTKFGVTQVDSAPASGVGQLAAYWYPGYFGNDMPTWYKMFRYARVTGDTTVGLHVEAVDDDEHPIDNPWVKDFLAEKVSGQRKVRIDRKARRCSPGIVFPSQDVNCAVVSLQCTYIPTSER